MNWFTSLIGLDEAIEARSTQIITPIRKSLSEINASLMAQQDAAAQEPVVVDLALQVTAVQQCARLIAQGLAQPSCKLLLTKDDGTRDEATNHPLYDVLAFAPNPEQTAFEFRETLGLHLALEGNAYVRVIRSGKRVVALWPIVPNDVVVHYNADRTCTYDVSGDGVGLTSRDVWHIRGFGWNGYEGLKAIHLAREAISLARATEKFGSTFFRNGARPSGIVSLSGNPTQEQLDGAAAKWEEKYGGVNNAARTVFVGSESASYTQVSSTANEAQWTESRRHQIEEICRAFGVRPSMVYTTGATSYASVEQEFLAHVKFTLAPWHTRWEQSAAKALLTPAERASGLRIKLNSDALLRGSIAERMQMYQTLVPLGAMTINEVRKNEDDPRLDVAWADEPRQAANIFGTPSNDTTSPDEGDSQDSEVKE